jgi:hypothetical protein
LLECEDIFDLVNIPAENRVKWGIAHIRGQAKTWISSSGIDLQRLTWMQLSQVLLDRFPDNVAIDPMDQLQILKQVNSVNTYIDTYEVWMTHMKREKSYLPQDFFVARFISGLKDSIKHTVQCQKPDTLLAAYWYVRQYEKAYLSNNKKTAITQAIPRAYPQQQPIRPIPAREVRNRAHVYRVQREPRKCWYCPDNWFLGHKCQPMQRALNAIEMQGHDEEQDRPAEILEEQVEPNDVPLHEQQANIQEEQPEQLMNISVVAYSGCPSNSTISLLLQFNKATAIALADTRSTSTFMDLAFARKHNFPLTPCKQQLVTVDGGGTLSSDVIAYDCKFSIQGHQFTTNFRIL